YLTIADAVSDLNAFGVCGAVHFDVAAGTYNEQMTLGKIDGASATNTITFAADTAGVIVEYGASGSADNWVLSLNATEWVTIDGFTFQNASGGSSSYRALCLMDGGSSNNTFSNNRFNFYNTTSSSSNTRGWTTNSADNNYNKFLNNEFINGGYYGFYFRGGGTTATNKGNEFDGNLFDGAYYYATYFYYGTDMKFNNNTILDHSSSTTTGYGLFMYYMYGHTEVIGNYIDYRYYCVRLYYWYGDQNNRSIVANNMIHAGRGSYTTYGLYMYYLEYVDAVHNTIWADAGPSSACYGVYAYNGSQNTFMNNIVYAPQGSSSYYGIYSPSTTAWTIDYNNVYTPTMRYGYYGTVCQDLAAWQSAGAGMNSYDADPGFTKKDSMYTCLDTINNAGTPIPSVTGDFQGDNRNLTTPDIGADEFIGGDSATFDAGPDGLLCNGNFIEIGRNITGAQFIWNTLDTTGIIMVNTVGDYTVSVNSACGGAFLDVVTVTDNTPNAVFSYTNSYYTGVFKNTSRTVGDLYRWVYYQDPAAKINPMDTVWTTKQKDQVYYFGDNGPHYVCLTTYNECDTVEICHVWTGTVGINEGNLSDAISLIPNPVSDRLTVQFNNFSGDRINVEMTNVQGQTVYSNQFVDINGNGNREINVSSLNKGMYIVKFTTENEVIAKQIIVQ
ncbi:MAG TPA: hypothetical protein DCX54_13490, partial [Flavobacteriales bacterium]|nr:hypothetical protein [Flavobacteriales bacterium]